MTPLEARVLLVGALVLLVWGLVWLFGPWALVGCGAPLLLVALLAPVKERRAEPADDVVPPG
jgi:hypothetical protein